MNISLTAKLEQFVAQKVSEGYYQDPSDVVRDALRALQAGERPTTIRGMDIEAAAEIVLMEAVRDVDSDLKAIMAEVRSVIAAKQELRGLISKVNRDVSNNLVQRQDAGAPLTFSPDGMGSEEAYHHAQLPVSDPAAQDGVSFVQTDLHRSKIDGVRTLEIVRDDLKGKLDGMNEMSEMTSLRLQMMMDRRSKFISTLSNIMKKISTTQDTLVQNLK